MVGRWRQCDTQRPGATLPTVHCAWRTAHDHATLHVCAHAPWLTLHTSRSSLVCPLHARFTFCNWIAARRCGHWPGSGILPPPPPPSPPPPPPRPEPRLRRPMVCGGPRSTRRSGGRENDAEPAPHTAWLRPTQHLLVTHAAAASTPRATWPRWLAQQERGGDTARGVASRPRLPAFRRMECTDARS